MERTIEDIIEEQRAKLHAEGKKVDDSETYTHISSDCMCDA
jgi:hypothetical protein